MTTPRKQFLQPLRGPWTDFHSKVAYKCPLIRDKPTINSSKDAFEYLNSVWDTATSMSFLRQNVRISGISEKWRSFTFSVSFIL